MLAFSQLNDRLKEGLVVPVKYFPSREEFDLFEKKLCDLGFFRIDVRKFRNVIAGLKIPRRRYGREVGFIFRANDLEVVVWTTWLESENCIRDEDAGWVLIRKGKTPLHFARPMNRTKNFLSRLLGHAKVAMIRIVNRPYCPVCNELMDITMGAKLKQRYWCCNRLSKHRYNRREYRSWDVGLTPEARLWIQKERAKRWVYEDCLKTQGKPLHTAMRRRRRWTNCS